MEKVLFKHSEGLKNTHNPGGRVVRSWRLLEDGTLQRTNNASKYVAPLENARIPQEVLDFAAENGITIKGLRPDIQGRMGLVTIFVLYGYDNDSAEDWDAATYALSLDSLPVGGFASQGMREEVAKIQVSKRAAEYSAAQKNTAAFLRNNR